MSKPASHALSFVAVLLLASLSPLAFVASAHPSIELSLDKSHVVIQEGYSDNVTLTINNNGSSIESYNISLDLANLPLVWNVTSVNETVDNVLPTFSADTSFIIRLDTGAVPSDSGSFDVIVTEPDADVSSSITVYVSVEPSYATSVSFNSMNGPLQQMSAGTSMNYTVDVWNDGNIEDTILLDVDVEPDLAAFWSGWTNNSGNNSSNNSGNNSVDNGTENNSGGNNTGGNNSNNNSGSSYPANILMLGNSYIYTNNVDELLHDMLNVTGQHNNTESLTGGGMRLSQHWNNVHTPGNSWNTTLRENNEDWDYVILQDQSQIPGFYRTSPDWTDSKNAAVNLSAAIEDENSETILMMTWGRRNGDVNNPLLYGNFTLMQDRLEQGYIDFRDNMTTPTRDVWIAPVGLAFKHIHDKINLTGVDPTLSGSTFFDLYNTDGSHPSVSGSYLAACVLFATMTGDSPVGSNDTVSLSANLKLELQQAAAATVFNETSHLTYPWQNSGSSIGPTSQSNRAIPPGWSVLFNDSQLADVAASTHAQTTIQISVPSDAVPGFYGFNLYSASAKGNVSTYSTMVIEVVAENNISAVFLDQDSNFIPGMTTHTSVQVTNLGNAELDVDWTLEVLSGPCNISLISTSSNNFAPDDVIDLDIQVIVDSNSSSADECISRLNGIASFGDQQYVSPNFDFTIGIDEKVEFEITGPVGSVKVTPGMPTAYELRLNNTGSEEVEFFLDIGSTSGLTTALTSPSGVVIGAGSVGTWNLTTNADSGMVGDYNQIFSVTYGSITDELTIVIEVNEVPSVSLTGPLDGRISIIPGESSSVELELTNIGTQDLNLSATVSGLPTGAQVSFDPISTELIPGQSTTINMTVSLISTSSSGVHTLTVNYGSVNASASISLELQIADSVGLTVNSVTSSISAGPLSSVDYTFEITNLGSSQDTFFIELGYDNSNNASNWYDIILSTTSVNLEPSNTLAITVSIRERSIGAPANGVPVTIQVSSTNDETVSDFNTFNIIPIQASAQLTILEDYDGAKPGESVSGTVIVTNTGSGIDQFLLSTPGSSCGLSEIFTLDAGASSQSFSWSCQVDNESTYGYESITFRVTSGARTTYVHEEVATYLVEPSWGSSGIVDLAFGTEYLSMSSSGGSSTTFTITNLANAPVTGTMTIFGDDKSMFDTSLTPINSNISTDTFNLGSGESMVYELLLNSRITESGFASIVILANVEIDGSSYPAESNNLSVEIEGPELPPQGVDLLFGVSLDKSQTVYTMFGGWIFSILLIFLMVTLRRRRKAKTSNSINDDEIDEQDVKQQKPKKEKEVKAHTLGKNECRMTSDNKVICPSCEAKLGVPRGSVPPFKFTCPKCDSKIRVVESQKF